MFLLGLLSILQAVFLPGFVVLRALRLNEGRIRTAVLALPISLLANHLFTLLTLTLRVYGRPAFVVLIAAEAAALAWQARGAPDRPAAPDLHRVRQRWALAGASPAARWIMRASLVSALAAAAWWAVLAWRDVGAVFSAWDTVVSYNRWALDWAGGRLPRETWTYPQVWPSTIALTYTIIGSKVQFFAMAIATLYPAALLAALFDLTLRLGDPRYALSTLPIMWLLTRLLPGYFMVGMADDQEAAMTIVTLYPLLLAAGIGESVESRRLVLAGALAAAAAALTKQTGWNTAGAYPVLAYLLVLRRTGGGLRRACGLGALVAALCVPWAVARVMAPSIIGWYWNLEGIHAGRTFPERAWHGVEILATLLEVPAASLLVAPVGLAASLRDRSWRWITLLVIVPSELGWLLLLSYDARNGLMPIVLAVPASIMGLIPAMDAQRLAAPGVRVRRRPGVAIAVAAAVAIAMVWADQTVFRRSVLRAAQDTLQREAYCKEVNEALYGYVKQYDVREPILSNYQVMASLPDVSALYLPDRLTYAPQLARDMQRGGYVFYYGGEATPAPVADAVAKGKLKLLGQGPTHRFYRIQAGP